jgi:peptidyl-prolyl cis-trans isomerase C
VREAVQQLPTALREQFQTPAGREEFIEAVLAKRLLRAEAERRGLTRSPEVLRQVQELEERLAIQALLVEAERSQGPVSEDELRRYYESKKQDFRLPRRVRASRVVLRGRTDDKALRVKLEALRQRALKKEPIQRVAASGEGPERLQGGDIGWVSEALDDETRAALALKAVGEVSSVVQVSGGLAFLVMTGLEEAREPDFEEVRQVVTGRYAPVRQRRVFDALVKRLKADTQAQVNAAAVR